jgi:hypothetical protein
MALVEGDVTIRVGSEDYVDLQLLQDDGVSPVNISGATKVELRLRSRDGEETIKKFADDDVPQKLYVTDAEQGEIQLRQVAADFATIMDYDFFVVITDSIGNHPVPEDKFYTWSAVESFGD